MATLGSIDIPQKGNRAEIWFAQASKFDFKMLLITSRCDNGSQEFISSTEVVNRSQGS